MSTHNDQVKPTRDVCSMTARTRVIILAVYLLAAAASIAWAQTALQEAETYGKLFLLGTTILGVLFGAAGAWFGLGYRVRRNTEDIGELCDWTEGHEDYHDERDKQLDGKLDRILHEVSSDSHDDVGAV